MYETNNNKTIYTIHIFFGFAFWKLKIRTKLGGHKRRRWKMFPVPSKITAVHYCPLPARGDPHPPPAMDLPRLTNPPHLRHPLFAEGGSTWISWSSNYLPDTNPLKKRRTMDDWGSDVWPNCFIVRKISRRPPNCFISGCPSWICFIVCRCEYSAIKLFHDLSTFNWIVHLFKLKIHRR